jgi:hypothetical protein
MGLGAALVTLYARRMKVLEGEDEKKDKALVAGGGEL